MSKTQLHNFENMFKKLNQAQKKAVESIEGPVLVLAGPGTGKTQVLSMRIAQILKTTDTQPENILALTFTDKAAHNMKKRLTQLIGARAYRVFVQTFHSFCHSVITANPQYFLHMRAKEPVGNIKKRQMIRDAIDQKASAILRPINAPDHFISSIIGAIDALKREGVDPKQLKQLSTQEYQDIVDAEQQRKRPRKTILAQAEKNYNKQIDLAKIYQHYQQELAKSFSYDFSDLISEVVAGFTKNHDLLADYQEQFQYFLVDEYQDTNASQNELLFQLASYWKQQANIFAVGDHNQSIFRFQGASSANTFIFLQKFPQAEVITLTDGYRCAQKFYDIAHTLIINTPTDALLSAIDTKIEKKLNLNQKLISQSTVSGEVEYITASHSDLEIAIIAKKIKEIIDQKINPSQIAIIYRTNKEANLLIPHLESMNIPYQVDTGSDLLAFDVAVNLLNLLEYLDHELSGKEVSDSLLFLILSLQWSEINLIELLNLNKKAKKQKTTLLQIIENQDLEQGTEENPEQEKKKALEQEIKKSPEQEIRNYLLKLKKLAVSAPTTNARSWFMQFLDQVGFNKWLSKDQNIAQNTLLIRSLSTQLEAWQERKSGLDIIQNAVFLLKNADQFEIHIPGIDLENAVRLTTAHKAKGQEWEYVFIFAVNDGNWGNRANKNNIPLPSSIQVARELSVDKNAEERRLFYVALTRASKKCAVSISTTQLSQDKIKNQLPSQFIKESQIDTQADLIENAESDQENIKSLEAQLAKTFHPPDLDNLRKQQYLAIIRDSIENFQLSASKLNLYLKDKNSFVDQYLLKLPQPASAILGYGSAIHASMEFLNRAIKENQQKPSLNNLLSHFHQTLLLQNIPERDLDFRVKQGDKTLTDLWQNYSLDQPLAVEKFFGSGQSNCFLDDIWLTGKVDRIDIIDKNKKLVRIIDYKTGSTKSLKTIFGQDSTALSEDELNLPECLRSSYQRQMVFYALLIKLDRQFDWHASEASFVFIDEKSNPVKLSERSLEITQDAVDELVVLIKKVIQEIRSLQFLE